MILVDVNILVHAFREDSPRHEPLRAWLEDLVYSEGAFALSALVLSGFLRIVTHPRVFSPPTPLESALEFVEALRAQPNCVPLAPGERHWAIFSRLCRDGAAKGNLVPDAYVAAIAIESGSELVTTDRDFARFPGLRWRPPTVSD
ncbi:MAG: type II toxin-antitoxin system VapC family toxin [Candidatus Bipolaricaulota bacterium]|nr:MAG: type II toxin-antitoxin system VapC family toxin [Candidatus Bipolaricaulota bacterium]